MRGPQISTTVGRHSDRRRPPETREGVCGVNSHFQGIYYQTREFGTFPGDFLALLHDDDRRDAIDLHLALNDTHVTMDLSSSYLEPGVIYPDRLKNGFDWTNNLQGIKNIVRGAINQGAYVDFALAGDGRSVNGNPQFGEYDDPVGKTYGYEWLMNNLERILRAFQGISGSEAPDHDDLTQWMLFRTGYDGVFYGWGNKPDEPREPDLQPARVIALGKRFREILPYGYLCIEHDTGHIPVGDGGREFSGGLQSYDVIASEFMNWPDTGDPTWQIAARMLGPAYRRPPEQPASDDQNPPFYLAATTPRGPYFTWGMEFAKFPESRGWNNVGIVDQARAYYRSLGYRYTG